MLGAFGRFGSACVFPVCQKIKEKYFSFLGGDLASVGLSNCATKLCVNLYTGPPNYFFSEIVLDSNLGSGVCMRGHVRHTPWVLVTYMGFSTVLVAMSFHESGKALARSATFNTVRNDTSRNCLALLLIHSTMSACVASSNA